MKEDFKFCLNELFFKIKKICDAFVLYFRNFYCNGDLISSNFSLNVKYVIDEFY